MPVEPRDDEVEARVRVELGERKPEFTARLDEVRRVIALRRASEIELPSGDALVVLAKPVEPRSAVVAVG